MASKEKKQTLPRVSFVVPCFKLGHLLKECVDSILTQTYQDFEILIMDDCSPDDTQNIAGSFGDPRIKHIRNDQNIGHLRNYNKGIDLALGEFIWLISADDRLRSPQVVECYVQVMEENPSVGYAICPGIGIHNGHETGLLEYSVLGEADRIIRGRDLLFRLLSKNHVLAAAGMVRRECYERFGSFPLDLPFAGDWYLWCLFALHYDIAYFAEPMVNYREHEQTMTNSLVRKDILILVRDDLEVRWRMRRAIEQINDVHLLAECDNVLVRDYAEIMTRESFKGVKLPRMSVEGLDESLRASEQRMTKRDELRGRIMVQVGDWSYEKRDFEQALYWYGLASMERRWDVGLRVKRGLLHIGGVGHFIRRTAFKARAWIASRHPG